MGKTKLIVLEWCKNKHDVISTTNCCTLEIEINIYIENYEARHKYMLSETYKTCSNEIF